MLEVADLALTGRRTLALCALAWTFGSACGGDLDRGGAQEHHDVPGGEDGGSGADGGGFGNPTPRDVRDAGADASPSGLLELTLEPEQPTLRVVHGEALPTLQFKVTSARGEVTALFRIDEGALGRIDRSGLFTPSGRAGGVTRVEARVGQHVLHTDLTIEIEWEQNGGETGRTPVRCRAAATAAWAARGRAARSTTRCAETLDSAPSADAALQWLYPVRPNRVPARHARAAARCGRRRPPPPPTASCSTCSGPHFEYRGYFGRPPALADGADFVRHPIPQDVSGRAPRKRSPAARSSRAERGQGRQGHTARSYRPGRSPTARSRARSTTRATAPTSRRTTSGARGGDGRFGGATLAIKPGAIGPVLVAGGDGGHDQCRVCHSVSSDGSRMTVQHGDDYDRHLVVRPAERQRRVGLPGARPSSPGSA